MNIKVSVVVPIYNVETYLEQCLDSILNQTLKEIEIICVDDGSTDKSGAILDAYAEKDSRIIVHHKQNTGYGNTMNVGFSLATGEYIGIVESDDFIAPHMYETLYETAKQHDLEIVKSERFSIYDSRDGSMHTTKDVQLAPMQAYGQILDMQSASFSTRIRYEVMKSIWCAIYRTDYIRENEILFHETKGASYQDTGFNFITMMTANRLMVIPDHLYYYRRNNLNSSSNSDALVDVLFFEYAYARNYLQSKNLYNAEVQALIDYCCLDNCELQFPRLGTQYVEAFVLLLKKYMTENEIVPSSDVMHHICNDTEWTIQSIIADKNRRQTMVENYMAFLNEAHRIVVYGAGICGEFMYETLGMLGLLSKVECFAVSSPQVNGAVFHDIPLRSIDSVTDQNCLVIVAAKRGNLVEMVQTSNGLGFGHVRSMLEFV